jgi:hypothetical protein
MRAALARVGQDARAVHRPDTALNLPDRGCLGMVIDATASRDASWNAAKKIQRQLFARVSGDNRMVLRLVVMRGGGFKDYGWHTDGEKLGSLIDRMQTDSGNTRIVDSLRAFIREPGGHKPAALILVGDCCEEKNADVLNAARELSQNGIRVYAFHETVGGTTDRRANNSNAENLFRQVAAITGGAFAKFGNGMPLADLCNAVAAYCAGGEEALKALGRRGDRAAQQLSAPRQVLLPGPALRKD